MTVRTLAAEALIRAGQALRRTSAVLVRAGYGLLADRDADARLLADIARTLGTDAR